MIDLTPLLHAIIYLAAGVLVAATPYMILWLERLFKIQQTAQVQAMNAIANAAVSDAAARGAGIAYDAIVASGGSYLNPVVRNSAIAAGLQHVLASLPDTLATSGITQDTVIRMVTGELGKLLAVDPTVTAVPTTPTTPVA